MTTATTALHPDHGTPLEVLIARHDLLSLTVSCIARDDGGHFYSANAQWADDTQQHGRRVAMARGDSANETVQNALAEMVKARLPAVELAA